MRGTYYAMFIVLSGFIIASEREKNRILEDFDVEHAG